ncbi:uncharacterized protein LOC128387518 [Panonychus citri]|uniref:uncharacterized protein LOC128387518 n=1 Tax=Panonychus citri TaxID=50023 RepID=UPI002307B859|nr:uncharacterized protein LOC128387518 [Panonychus citri]
MISPLGGMQIFIYQWIHPSSLYAQSILRQNRLSQIIHILVTLVLIVKGLFGLFIIFYESDYSNNIIAKIETIWSAFIYIMYGITSAYYLVDRSLFIEFLKSYTEIIDHDKTFASEFTTKQFTKIKLFVLYCFCYETSYEIVKCDLRYIPEALVSPDNYLVKYSLITIILFFYKFGILSQFHFILEICFHLEAVFAVHKRCLNTLSFDYLDLRKDIPEQKIRLSRFIYSKIIKTCKIIDKFLFLSLLTFYIFFVGLDLFAIRGYFVKPRPSLVFTIFKFFGETNYLILITYHLIKVNQLSNKLFNKVYELSFDNKSFGFVNEVRNSLCL